MQKETTMYHLTHLSEWLTLKKEKFGENVEKRDPSTLFQSKISKTTVENA